MSSLPDHERGPIALSALEDEQETEFSRRTMLAGAMATTAIAAVGAIDTPSLAQSVDSNTPHDMVAFLLLSSALTGIVPISLAPGFNPSADILDSDPGSDPINIKRDYFEWVYDRHAATFENLLQIAKDHRDSAADIISNVSANDDTKYLGRSIVLMWYLGSWYDPADLASATGPIFSSEVVSAKAYTQGWIWQIAQAHPMGYSNLQFGYWSRVPVDKNDKNSPSGFITTDFRKVK
jgi:hypothetical protein